jgi:hypothetical protein
MMDLTIAGSGDTSTTGVDVMSSTNNEPDPDLDCVQQKVGGEVDDKNNDSDCTESVINEDEIMGNSNDTEDMPPLDVNSEGSVIGDVMSGFDEPEISTIPSDLSTSPQMSSHDVDSQKQNHLDLLSSASDQRAEGKTLHDSGNLADAALAFQKAALLLDEAITISIEFSEDEASDIDFDAISVERATCRLHEALCLFKDGRPGECIEACTDVLEDGVSVISLEEEVGNDDTETSDSNDTSKRNNVGSVKVITSPVRNNENVDSRTRRAVPPQIRARAFHRRAKARLALDDLDGALEDARSAAFMGDRNAVQFYGRLMREGSGAGATASGVGSLAPLGGLGAANPSTTNPFLEGILGGIGGNGNNPFMPVGAGSSDFSSSLLSTLLSSGNGSSSGGGSGGGSPLLGLMGDLLSPQPMVSGKRSGRGSRGKSKKGGGADSLAKSILTSLMKRIEDEDTQSTICKYLHSTNTQQVMQYATMAGIPMKEGSARRLVSFANGVTPKGIRKSISNVKRGISVIKTLRKIFKVIEKYKYIIILTVTCYWIRSAIVEPYPVRRSKKQAQELTQKAALSFILPSRGVRGSLITLTSGVVDSLSRSFLVMEDKFAEDDESTELEELNYLQNQLSLIEAIEVCNFMFHYRHSFVSTPF